MAVQTKNAAILIKENELNNFKKQFESLLQSQEKQDELSKNIKRLALPNATTHIANEVEELLNKN